MIKTYQTWLDEHHQAAKVHYDQLSKLDDQEQKVGGSSEYYELAHQMFGYIAALETCIKHFKEMKGAQVSGKEPGKNPRKETSKMTVKKSGKKPLKKK